ncbi:ZIP family metal transporter [Patescibacteria group bacterium]|nr:ZIP family metal transporter [Patescibacteria group bacterium]
MRLIDSMQKSAKSLLKKYWPFLVIILVTVLFFWKFFFRGLVPIPADFIVGVYYPWLDYKWLGYLAGVPVKNPLLADVPSLIYTTRVYAMELLQEGVFPLWNPLQFGGYPLLATFQSAVLYPLNLLYFALDPVNAWSVQVILQPFLIASFTYLLLRRINLSKTGSLLGGITFAFSGFNIIWLEYNIHGHVASVIPLALLFTDKYLEGKRFLMIKINLRNGLKKICKKYKIPVPGRGYWAKKAAGYTLKQKKLPKIDNPALEEFSITGSPASNLPDILMLTLSVHSLITGMALGLETHLVSAGAILFAILAHKSTAAMALSISFAKGDAPPSRSRNLLWIFYTTTPIGILGGAWVGAYLQGPGEVHFEAVFDALAAGTFFYIAVMDILAEEFQENHNHGQKFLMVTLGFGIMAVVAIWT